MGEYDPHEWMLTLSPGSAAQLLPVWEAQLEKIQKGVDRLRTIAELDRPTLRAPLSETPSMPLSEVPIGAEIWWPQWGEWRRVTEVRRHALTIENGTVWVFLDGVPCDVAVPLDMNVLVRTVFS